MTLSNKNATILLLDTHQDIEEYADVTVNKILTEREFDFMTYPPNCGLTEEEKTQLSKLADNKHLKSALRKIIADNSAGVVFNILNLIDGTGFPKNDSDQWTEIKLVDEEDLSNEPVTDWLHDKFYETYWDWKKRRGTKDWSLDTLSE